MHRLLTHPRCLAALAGLAASALLFLPPTPARPADKDAAPDKAAVERTRETVRMLDDLYKSAIVHVTATYVKARERTPAARAAKLIFKDMSSKGWHIARLVDATGDPVNKANVAKSAFEKEAVAKIKGGKPYVEEIGTSKGKPVLRAATVVPVVMKACINCHPGHKEGDVLGFISYEVPIK